MQNQNIKNNTGNLKLVEVNKCHTNRLGQKNFMNGLQNARNILDSLERSINETRRYERRLLHCKASHHHTHSSDDWWDREVGEDVLSKSSKETKASRNQVDLAESWSTMSIVCLQYQYEELAKRYDSLLRAYDARCRTLDERDITLTRLERRVRMTQARVAHGHRALLDVGDKYLALRDRKVAQKTQFMETVRCMKATLREVMRVAQKARRDLDAELGRKMAAETDVTRSLLLAEIRKCNRLCLENMRLKTQMKEFASPQLSWQSSCLASNCDLEVFD